MFTTYDQLTATELFEYYGQTERVTEFMASLLFGDTETLSSYHWVKDDSKTRNVNGMTRNVYDLKYLDKEARFLIAEITQGLILGEAKFTFPMDPVSLATPIVKIETLEGEITNCKYYPCEGSAPLTTEEAIEELKKYEYHLLLMQNMFRFNEL